MKKIIIIGGGAAGIACSIFASNNNNQVIVLERNNEPLKKLLLTGNGKCNFFNEEFNLSHYCSDNLSLLNNIINNSNKDNILTFFNNIGIVSKIKNGYYYPYSNQAYSIKNALLKEAELRGVEIKTNIFVSDINKKNDKFIINTSMGNIECDKVVIATGSKAYPKTGSDGLFYDILKNLGHNIKPVLPGLVGLETKENVKELSGVRCEVKVDLVADDKLIKSEVGEIQFTDYGLSGICIYNLSNRASFLLNENKKIKIKINLLAGLSINNINDFIEWFNQRTCYLNNRNLTLQLEGFLNYKVVNFLVKKHKLSYELSWNDLNYKEKTSLAKDIIDLEFNVTKPVGFDKSQICLGGVSLSNLNIENFESKIIDNLFLCGEILDVAGDCGGYNLGFAFLSGMIAGKNIGEK